MAEDETRPLDPPVVDPAAYDESYYLEWCAGYEQWRESGGRDIAPVYEGALQIARLTPGETVVDIGTGRGELLAVAARLGAERAVGVEYAPAAVELARTTLSHHDTGGRAEVIQADARAVPLEDGVADLVTLLDVVEHLAPAELERTLAEARRMLRPGGRVLIHTAPNRLVYDITYRLQRLARPARLRSWPRNPRNQHELRMHVNEQTLGSLRSALRAAGFDAVEVWLGEWLHLDFVPDERARRTWHRLAARRLTRGLVIADIWARAVASGR
jgi:SAM-dependent methyltransferase